MSFVSQNAQHRECRKMKLTVSHVASYKSVLLHVYTSELNLTSTGTVNFQWFQGVRLGHGQVQSSFCCFPWDLVSFVYPSDLLNFVCPRKLVSFDK